MENPQKVTVINYMLALNTVNREIFPYVLFLPFSPPLSLGDRILNRAKFSFQYFFLKRNTTLFE